MALPRIGFVGLCVRRDGIRLPVRTHVKPGWRSDLNIVGMWWLAFGAWPNLEPSSPRQPDRWSDGDNEEFKKLLAKQRRP